MIKERLDDVMESLGIWKTYTWVERTTARIRTKDKYTQNKFNLLREETEGYSKLVVELFNALPTPTYDIYAADRRSTRKSAADLRVKRVQIGVNKAQQVIKSLVGQFGLDPNRVLDLVLDMFIANTADQWDFFVELLKSNSNWSNSQRTEVVNGKERVINVPNDVCSQILGFKFDFYNQPDVLNGAPTPLFYVAAVLIREGIVGLDTLYPHLMPNDEAIEKEYRNYVMEQERPRPPRFGDQVERHSAISMIYL